MSLTDPLFTVGEVAARLTLVSKESEEFLARQIRNVIRTGGFKPRRFAGPGKTAPALIAKGDICWLAIAHALLDWGFGYDVIAAAADYSSAHDMLNLPVGVTFDTDGLLFAIEEIRNGREAYFHLAKDVDGKMSGYFSTVSSAVPDAPPIILKKGYVTLPLSVVFGPIVATFGD